MLMETLKHIKSCPIELVVKLINKKWVIQIIRDLFFGKSRFHVLSNCLKDMEKNGLIHKIVDKCDKKNVKYILTEKGKSLNKVLYEIAMIGVDGETYSDSIKNSVKNTFRETLL